MTFLEAVEKEAASNLGITVDQFNKLMLKHNLNGAFVTKAISRDKNARIAAKKFLTSLETGEYDRPY